MCWITCFCLCYCCAYKKSCILSLSAFFTSWTLDCRKPSYPQMSCVSLTSVILRRRPSCILSRQLRQPTLYSIILFFKLKICSFCFMFVLHILCVNIQTFTVLLFQVTTFFLSFCENTHVSLTAIVL